MITFRKSYTLLSFLMLLSLSASMLAQDFDNYQLLTSTGNIPSDFLIPSSVKYEKEIQTIDKQETQKDKNDKKQFFLESSFLIDELLRGPKVFFNDPITKYVNKVADELLKNDPELRKKLRFYTIRSSAVNAFATNQGIIFVNVGLLAQLESEAQLAFVLAHEIAHVKDGHALEMYMEAQRIDRYTKRSELIKNTSFENQIVAKNFYSKELETCADRKGLELFLESNYCMEELDGVFDVLQYAYLPFDVIPFETSFLENEHIQLPEDYSMAQEDMNGISDVYDEDDSKSTHPSIESRREAVANTIANQSNQERKKYVSSDITEFQNIRDIARFEIAYYYLHNFRFQDAIYAAYVLLQKYPESRYLKKIVSKSLYGYTKFKNDIKGYKSYAVSYNNSDFNTEHMSKNKYKKIEGPTQQIYHILSKMRAREITVLSLRYLWDVCTQYPDDAELQKIQEDLFMELAYHYNALSDFSSITKEEIKASKDTSLTDETVPKQKTIKKLSKYDKIKLQKKEKDEITNTKEEGYDLTKFAFTDVIKNSAFKKQFKEGQKEKKRRDKIAEYYNSSEGRDYLRKRRRKNATALGIDSVLVYTPFYKKVESNNNSSKVLYLKSEENQERFVRFLRKNAALAKLNITLLNPTELKETDGATYNDLRMLSDWISQQNRFGSDLLMPAFNQDIIEKLIKKYKTKYLLFTGIISIKHSSTHWAYWSALYNMETGRYQIIKDDYFRQKDGPTFINAQLYDTFFQIKSKRK